MTKRVTTFCRICEATCGLVAEVDENRILSIAPDPDHVVTKGFACVKGLRQHRIVRSPDRLETPMKRVGDRFVPIAWDDAIGEIGAKLRALRAEHGPDAIGFYLGNPVSLSFLPPILAAGFMQGIGSKNFFQTGSQDCNNKFAVAERMYGYPFIQPFPDLDHTRCLVLVGTNPAVSKMSFIHLPNPAARLRAIEKRGGQVFHVNPRRTETAKLVGEHVFIRPDTDVFFYLSFLNEVLASDAIDRKRVAVAMKGAARIAAIAARFPAERTEEVTGIPTATLKRIVAAYLAADGAALFSSTGVNQGSDGTLAFFVQEVINAVTGNLDRRGGTLVGEGYVKDFAKHARAAGNAMRTDRSRVGSLPSVVDSLPAGILADEILTPGPGKVRAMVVMAGNPLLSVPNADAKLERAFRDLELLVSIDLFRNETGNLANYLLPGTHALERADLPFVFQSLVGLTPIPYVQATDAVVTPYADQRDEVRILLDLAQAAGVSPFGSRAFGGALRAWIAAERIPGVGSRLGFTSRRMLDLIARALSFGGLDALLATPHGRLREPNRPGTFLGKRVVTDDGLVDLCPPDLEIAARGLEGRFADERARRHRLKVISKRESNSHNSWMHNHEELVRGRRTTNHAHLHPDDARRCAVEDGTMVEVTSERGSIVLPVRVTDEMMIGAVAIPHGFGHAAATGLTVARTTGGANVNLLADDGPDSVDPISGMARLNGILVDVRPAPR